MPKGTATSVHFLSIKSRKKLATDIFNYILVHDATDTDCWAQDGSTHGCVTWDFPASVFKKWNKKLNEK